MPEYRLEERGPDHAKEFTATVFVAGEALGNGTGRSKKEAEQQAAREAHARISERLASQRVRKGDELELPEVEVMRRDLEKDVIGRRIKEAEVKPSKNAMRVIRRHPKRKDFTSRLEGRKITKVERRGKYLVMPLDSGDVLVTHFGMSGQFQRGTGRVAMPAAHPRGPDVPAGRRPPLHRPAHVRRDVRVHGRRGRQDQGAPAPRDRPARSGLHVARRSSTCWPNAPRR